ncbi:MAG: GDP-mannose 4,6-dehydratase [Eubacteriales bacterium]|nr:GDP-mannose 4,6-dehydratase [Eubacteriales bacterium]
MKAMIIGAAGFVGSYLSEAIRTLMSCEVVATKLAHEKTDIPDAEIIDLDILDQDSVYEVLAKEKPDYIFHLAAQSSVALSWKNPKLTVDVNIIGALNLLDAIRRLDYSPRVLIVGSGEEYGRVAEVPIEESCALNPGNIYAVTKACQNMLSTLYSKAYGLNLIMTRSFNHIGPKQIPQFVVADFCSQVAKIEKGLQEPVIRVGNLSAKRDFTDVRDVVSAYCSLIQHGKPGETYNVGSGHAIAVEDILREILSQSSANIKVEIDPAKLRPVDVPIIEPDTKKIFNDTGWTSSIPLKQTISDTLDYWRNTITA